MIIFKKIPDLQYWILQQKKTGKIIGFVPTMGALHPGHEGLIQQSKADNNCTICSIFINPTQFNDKADFAKYPVTPEADIALLLDAHCDVVFMPEVKEMYPPDAEVQVYSFGHLENILEGAQRPGHFKGVGQIVSRLLNIVMPDKLYMGQKDFQQCMIVRSLLQQMNLENKTKLIVCPTSREADGLAMSSRNQRLTEPQRALAGIIYQCLVSIQNKKADAPFEVIKKECEELLLAKGLMTEYIALADADSLELLDNYNAEKPMVALIAAKLGNVRLIDNMLI